MQVSGRTGAGLDLLRDALFQVGLWATRAALSMAGCVCGWTARSPSAAAGPWSPELWPPVRSPWATP